MNKRILHNSLLSVCISLFFSGTVFGQQEITLDPTTLTPADDGYYIGGVMLDTDDDGTEEFYNGCTDHYEYNISDGYPDEGWYNVTLNHKETGTQQDFYYHNCMIMPDCEAKGTPIDPAMRAGYIQMHACVYSGTDSAIISYIQSPAIVNLTSFTIETSADVSLNDNRNVVYNIEYSKDGGTTWEATYLMDALDAQGGYRVTYDGETYLEIQEMLDASTEGPIVMRLITNDRAVDRPNKGQFVKLHSWVLNAEIPSNIETELNEVLTFNINGRLVSSESGNLSVFNPIGQLVGEGMVVEVPKSGIYIVRDNNNKTQKVFIK